MAKNWWQKMSLLRLCRYSIKNQPFPGVIVANNINYTVFLTNFSYVKKV